MTIFMSDILCVTNRRLCEEDFLTRAEKIAAASPAGIILREKDLSQEEYYALAQSMMVICKKQQLPCILHTFTGIAEKLGAKEIHLPMPVFRTLTGEKKAYFRTIGVSCHSVLEAKEAERLGASYITAGHIFETDCKWGLPGRGLSFLKEVCNAVNVPVYAIGGITPEKIAGVRQAGAAGACVMSSLMQCDSPEKYLAAFQ